MNIRTARSRDWKDVGGPGSVGSYFFRRDVTDFARDVAMRVIADARAGRVLSAPVELGRASDGTVNLPRACLCFCRPRDVSRRRERLASLRTALDLGGPRAVFDLLVGGI